MSTKESTVKLRGFLIDHIGYAWTRNTKNLRSLGLLEVLDINPARNLDHKHLLECPLFINGLVSVSQQPCRLVRCKSKIGEDIAIRRRAVGNDFLAAHFREPRAWRFAVGARFVGSDKVRGSVRLPFACVFPRIKHLAHPLNVGL